jgi:hypothetical protein
MTKLKIEQYSSSLLRIDSIPFLNERNPPLRTSQNAQSEDILQLVFLTLRYHIISSKCTYYGSLSPFVHEEYVRLAYEKFKHKAFHLLNNIRETHSRIVQRYAQATCFSQKMQDKIIQILNGDQFQLQESIE